MTAPSASATAYYYYDAHSNCIKYDSRLISQDGSVIIRGAIVVDIDIDGAADGDDSNRVNIIASTLPLGKVLTGEIIDIVADPSGERRDSEQHSQSFMQTAASSLQLHEGGSTTTSAEQLLQRHRRLQSVHARQYQGLLHKQAKDWHWFYSKNLSEERLLEMTCLHQKESMELQARQHREQCDMLEFFVSNWVSMDTKVEISPPSMQSRQATTTSTTTTSLPLIAAREHSTTKTSGVSILVEKKQEKLNAAPPPQSTPPSLSLPDRISMDRQKADEIKAVMRDRSLSQTKRQQKLEEIREKYIAGIAVGATTTTLPFHHLSTTDDTSDEHCRQLELQAIMKDPTLSRETKLDRIALVNAKFALGQQQSKYHGQETTITQHKRTAGETSIPASRQNNDTYTPTTGNGDDNDRSINSDSQSLETNQTSGSPLSSHFSTSSASSSSIVSSSSSSSIVISGPESDDDDEEEVDDAIVRVGVIDSTHENIHAPTAAPRLSTSHLVGNGAGYDSNHSGNLNNPGLVLHDSAANVANLDSSAKNVMHGAVSDDPFQGIPTDRTPMKKLIKKLTDNDVSLTMLKLDGRTQIKENYWKSLFQSLESNSTLTHLSISRCEMNDEVATALVLAMVVNESIVGLRLNHNEGLTDETGKGLIKVLRESNSTIKTIEVSRTNMTTKLTQKLNILLEERDPAKVDEQQQNQVKSNGKDKHRRRSILALAKSVTSSKKA